MMIGRVVVVALSLATAVAARGDDTVRIIVTVNPPVGRSQRGMGSLESNGTTTVRGVDGRVMSRKHFSSSDHEEYVDSTLPPSKGVSRYKRQYIHVLHDDEKGTEFGPMNGRSIVLTAKRGPYDAASDDGKALTPEERTELIKLLQQSFRVEANNVCVSRDPLAVGATWTVTAVQLEDCFSPVAHVVKESDGRATLADIESRNGHRYALVDFRFTRSVDHLGPLVFDAPVDAETASRLEVSLDDPATWKRTSTTALTGNAHPRGPDKPSLTMELRIVETLTSEP